jgi:hypothetical protein
VILIFESMLRKVILSFLYIFFTASLLFALLFWFLQGTLFNNVFYTEQILPQIYPTVVQDIAQYAINQDPFLLQHVSVTDMENIVRQSFPQSDAKEMTNMLFDRFFQRVFSDEKNMETSLDLKPFKDHFLVTLQHFLVSFVQKLPVCQKPEDAMTFSCRMGDTSPEAVSTFINSFIDPKAVLHNVPDSIYLAIPAVPFPAFLFRMDMLWYTVFFFPFLFLLLLVAASYRNLKVFFKKQGWIFLLLGILFFLVSLVLTELFSFAKYQLEQEMGDSKKYLNLFYGTYSTTVRTELLWTAAVLVFIGMMCFLFFFSFRSSDKKKR